MALVTMLLRFLPFLLFRGNKKTPDFISYLGQVLPFAIIGMLVVFCLKNVDFPAPLAPIRQWTSPRFTLKLTLSNAFTPGKYFSIFFISSMYSLSCNSIPPDHQTSVSLSSDII